MRRSSPAIHRPIATLVAVVITVVAVAATTLPAAVAAEPDQAWIVVLSDEGHEVPSVAAILTNAFGGELGYVYEHALEGFSVTMTPTEADALAASPLVAWVEPVVQITFAQQTTPAGVTRIGGTNNPDVPIGSGAAIDVDVAVIDTGVDFEHPDLNVVGGVDCAGVGSFAECVPGGDDDHYHGTHVAGTIAALDNGIGSVGVAPGARVWAVKVLMSDGVGSTAGVIAGIDWVTANADVIEVANMSLAGPGYSHAEYLAVQRAVDAGVAFVAAAGNDATDASYFSPASFGNVLTVSALADYDGLPGGYAGGTCRADPDDTLAEFSNWGSAVDIAAPGTCIRSTVPLEYGVYGTLSGTSMAAPHVAAGVALLAAADPPTNAAEVQALYDIVVESGNIGWTDTSGDGYFEPLLHVARFSPLSGLLPLYESEPGSGDVNCDAEMSIVDALIVAQHAAGLRGDANGCDFGNALVELHADAGDINDDTRVDIVDALLIARCVAGLDAC